MSIFRNSWLRLRYILVLGILLCCYGGGRAYFHYTDGFSVSGISAPWTYDARWEVGSLSEAKRADLRDILSQKFYYLAKGTQSYVLASEDGRYVIKFFKQKHLRFPRWMETASSFPLVGDSLKRKRQRRSSKRDKIFAGCKLAYETMQKDSGVAYVHLNPSDWLDRELTIVDKLGLEHTIDPNAIAFYIQRRGESVHVAFQRFSQEEDFDGAKAALRDLFSYLEERSERGILDRDPNYINNLGFIDAKAGTLDVGNLTMDPMIKNRVEYSRRMIDHTAGFRGWLESQLPPVVEEYDAQIRRLERGPQTLNQGTYHG